MFYNVRIRTANPYALYSSVRVDDLEFGLSFLRMDIREFKEA